MSLPAASIRSGDIPRSLLAAAARVGDAIEAQRRRRHSDGRYVDAVPQIGDPAPAFYLADQTGDKTRLSSFEGRKVLVYFYPKADTPGCTTQSCGLRDIAGDIGATAIVGISPDPPEKLASFDEKCGLGFTLLSDPEHEVAEAYGVWGEKKMYGKTYLGIIRSAFLVDEAGMLAQAWPKVSPKDTPKKLLGALADA
ncbi:thioredoxin-dependent thiol peroxidase [soil metagenome]